VPYPPAFRAEYTFQSARRGRESGCCTVVSALEGKERIFGFRKLPRIPVYMTAGVDTADITDAWLVDMSPSHLRFGTALIMIALCLWRCAAPGARPRQPDAARRNRRRQATGGSVAPVAKMERSAADGGIAHDFNTCSPRSSAISISRAPRLERGSSSHLALELRQAAEAPHTLVSALLSFSRSIARGESVDINGWYRACPSFCRTLGEIQVRTDPR